MGEANSNFLFCFLIVCPIVLTARAVWGPKETIINLKVSDIIHKTFATVSWCTGKSQNLEQT